MADMPKPMKIEVGHAPDNPNAIAAGSGATKKGDSPLNKQDTK